MKYLLLLLPLIVLAQVPSAPTNLRITLVTTAVDPPIGSTIAVAVSKGTNNPMMFPQELAAWWREPTVGVWRPEFSTNGVTWTPTGNEWIGLGERVNRTNGHFSGWHFTETGTKTTNWLGPNQWQVQIRRVK